MQYDIQYVRVPILEESIMIILSSVSNIYNCNRHRQELCKVKRNKQRINLEYYFRNSEIIKEKWKQCYLQNSEKIKQCKQVHYCINCIKKKKRILYAQNSESIVGSSKNCMEIKETKCYLFTGATPKTALRNLQNLQV